MTACPKTLQVVTVGKVTSPVTHVAVVAVNNASIYEIDSPVAELIGSARSTLPTRIAKRKLSKIICEVENLNKRFFFITFPLSIISTFIVSLVRAVCQFVVKMLCQGTCKRMMENSKKREYNKCINRKAMQGGSHVL